jgi:putative ABC transport system ATP-binding protein
MPLVSVRALTRHYQQGPVTVKALDGVDLDIEAGEFTALMGPSGSGKTTLLNLIGGLDGATSGQVVVDGQDLSEASSAERSELRRRRLGFVFQAYNLIPVFSALENTEFVMALNGVSTKERRDRCRAVLEQVGLKGLEDRRPGELSGGQQQRVAVARAIVGEPAVVLADEPTANLDSHTSDELIALMKHLNEERGVTFLFSTHDPKIMHAARRVVRLLDGRVEADERKAG